MRSALEYLKSYPEKCAGIEGLLRNMSGVNVCEGEDFKNLLSRGRATNKGDFGAACLVAGSEKYLGAATLSVSSALRSGCGYVYAVVPQSLKYALAAAYPQGIYVSQPYLNAGAIAFGMGLGCNEDTYSRLKQLLLSYGGKLIIDADGLNSLAKYGLDALKDSKAEIILTPHVGEMSRLCAVPREKIVAEPVAYAQEFCQKYNVSVHLKNAVSVTCSARSAVAVTVGCSALAKAGSGDILSGLLCGLAAQGIDLFTATACAQYVVGKSAEISSQGYYQGSVTAQELVKNIGIAIYNLMA